MQNASWLRRFHSNILLPMLCFPWPLMPPTPMWEVSCKKNQETIGILLVFFSKKLTETESTFDRELLAVYLFIRHFHYFVKVFRSCFGRTTSRK
jgi:hypothetical protein